MNDVDTRNKTHREYNTDIQSKYMRNCSKIINFECYDCNKLVIFLFN